jgi:hypothetical protein
MADKVLINNPQSTIHNPQSVLYSAPGSGLGHLVRACAVCLALADRGVCARILTNSPFAPGMARLTGCDIVSILSRRWRGDAPALAAQWKPTLIVTDTFPWGLRGEWLEAPYPGARFAHLARRLRVRAYTDALGAPWAPAAPQLRRVVIIEPLAGEHETLLRAGAAQVVTLPGRIRFPHERLGPPPDLGLRIADCGLRIEKTKDLTQRTRRNRGHGEKQTTIDEPRATNHEPRTTNHGLRTTNHESPSAWLVVHSGPPREIQKLITLARQAMPAGAPLVVVSPWPPEDGAAQWREYFPAALWFDRIAGLVTGAGYNALADGAGAALAVIRHPFPRRYDDQRGRLLGAQPSPGDGAHVAADAIISWM